MTFVVDKVSIGVLNIEVWQSYKQANEGGSTKMAHKTLLFIDDDERILKSARMAMEKAGFKVLTAQSGPEALMLVDNYRQDIDLVFSDVIMPGIKGNDLAVYLRSKRPKSKIIFMSGYTDDILNESGIEKHETVFLHKPFSLKTLLNSVENVLG